MNSNDISFWISSSIKKQKSLKRDNVIKCYNLRPVAHIERSFRKLALSIHNIVIELSPTSEKMKYVNWFENKINTFFLKHQISNHKITFNSLADRFPASPRRCFNVIDVQTTLLQRSNDIVCLLGWEMNRPIVT